MLNNTTLTLSKPTIRWTGLLYLLVIICAGFSQGYVRGNLIVPGDAATTTQLIAENPFLFRLGFAGDLIAFTLDAIISVLFFLMFREVNRKLALISSALRLIAHPAIGALNLVNHYLALQFAEGSASFLSGFTPDQLQSFTLLFTDAHRMGYLVAGALFGIHCLLLGLLIIKSGFIPKVFGALMLLAAIGYVMESFGGILFPGNEVWLGWIVGITAALGELELCLFLLIKGYKTNKI